MSQFEDRLRSLELWRADVGQEFRELEEWHDTVTPFLEQLQADLVYRQRRHAESVRQWSFTAKAIAWAAAILVSFATVGGFVLQVLLLTHGGAK